MGVKKFNIKNELTNDQLDALTSYFIGRKGSIEKKDTAGNIYICNIPNGIEFNKPPKIFDGLTLERIQRKKTTPKEPVDDDIKREKLEIRKKEAEIKAERIKIKKEFKIKKEDELNSVELFKQSIIDQNMKYYDNVKWNKVQSQLINIFDNKDINARSVLVILDFYGCTGKSWVVDYLKSNYNILASDGRYADICLKYEDGFIQQEKLLDGIILDIPRANTTGAKDQFNYGVIEKLQASFLESTKYRGASSPKPKVPIVVFTNNLPDLKMFSYDRWRFIMPVVEGIDFYENLTNYNIEPTKIMPDIEKLYNDEKIELIECNEYYDYKKAQQIKKAVKNDKLYNKIFEPQLS